MRWSTYPFIVWMPFGILSDEANPGEAVHSGLERVSRANDENPLKPAQRTKIGLGWGRLAEPHCQVVRRNNSCHVTKFQAFVLVLRLQRFPVI